MPSVTKNIQKTDIVSDIASLIIKNNQAMQLQSNPEQLEILKEISNTLKKVKEQNDEIIGDEF